MIHACDAVGSVLHEGHERSLVARVRAGLAEPLRVAVAGRVNGGKSTLVNALLGQRVAPTDVSECTRYVTWYRHGLPERCEVVGRDGTRSSLPLLTDGSLPRSPGTDIADIGRLEVFLANDALRHLVLIDTPGLGSLNAHFSAGTTELLGLDGDSRDAVAQADALVFVLTGSLRDEEAEVLRAFRDVLTGTSSSSISTVCVLNKADLVGDGDGDPLDTARRLAARYGEELRDAVIGVHPLVSLLAETVGTGRFNEHHAAALRALAALPEASRRSMLISADRFRTAEGPMGRAERDALLELLGLYGIGVALDLIAGGTTRAADLLAELRARSGMSVLADLVLGRFTADADALKADAALLALERLSYAMVDPAQRAGRDALHDAIEEVRVDPSMHRLLELRALQETASGLVELPADLASQLPRLTGGGTPSERLGLPAGSSPEAVQQAALDAAAAWKRFRNDGRAGPAQQWVADVLGRTCDQLWLAGRSSGSAAVQAVEADR